MSPRCAQTQEIEVTGAEKQTTLLAGRQLYQRRHEGVLMALKLFSVYILERDSRTAKKKNT